MFQSSSDFFASPLNTQVALLISYRPDAKCVAINVFTRSWKDLDFYAFPPFIFINKVSQKIWKDKAKGIIVVPD